MENGYLGKKIIATRLSQLAQCQTHLACQWLRKHSPSFEYETLGFSTQGDRLIDIPLKDIGGKGAFVKELQQALLERKADFAVHSMKDLPLTGVEGLSVSGFYAGENAPFDVLVSAYLHWENLPSGSCIGTSSLRRAVQFLKLRPDCIVRPLRGNVLTRLERLNKGDFNGLILAEAGLNRLQLKQPYDVFELHEMVPAFNQGILGIECRDDDTVSSQLLGNISDRSVALRTQWERTIAQIFDASCKSAIGVYAQVLSCEPLSVHLYIFACKNWDCMQSEDAIFSNLDLAKQWTKEQFDCDHTSWAICQVTFT